MAYVVHWRGEFTDNEGEDWKIDILEDDYAGAVDTMQMTGNPLIIDWPSTSDDLHDQHIRGSQAKIEVYSESDMEYATLFTSDKLEYKVNIYYNDTTLYWTGFVTTDTWQEPYADCPYRTVISATDGLGILKDFDFSDLLLQDRQTASKIIHDILEQVEIDTFTEYINLYHADMAETTTDSPLDQCRFWTYLWRDNSCYEALEDILGIFNAAIKQEKGEYIIYRYKELDDTTMYGRTFTTPTAKSGTTKTPLQYINRAAQSSNFIEVGGTVTITPQLKQLNILQTYGQLDSMFLDSDFDFGDFDGTDFPNWTRALNTTVDELLSVTNSNENGVILDVGQTSTSPEAQVDTVTLTGTSGTADVTAGGLTQEAMFDTDLTTTASAFASDYAADYDTEGITVTSSGADIIFTAKTAGVPFSGTTSITNTSGNLDGSVTNTTANRTVVKIYQSVADYQSNGNDARYDFSIDYTAYNSNAGSSASGNIHIRVWVENASLGNRYMQSDGTWTAADTYISRTIASTAAESYNSWQTFSLSVRPSPYSGTIHMELVGATSTGSDLYAMYRNLSFVDNETNNIKTISYTVTNAVNGGIIDLDYNVGDGTQGYNCIVQEEGSIQVYSTGISDWVLGPNNMEWRTRGNTENDPIIELIGGEIGAQFSRPKHLLDIGIYERSNDFLNTIGRIEDVLNTYSGSNRMFVIYQATYDVRMRKWNLNLNELL